MSQIVLMLLGSISYRYGFGFLKNAAIFVHIQLRM